MINELKEQLKKLKEQEMEAEGLADFGEEVGKEEGEQCGDAGTAEEDLDEENQNPAQVG